MARWEAERRALRQTAEEAAMKKVRPLLPREGSGPQRAWVFVRAFVGGRAVRHGKEGGLARGARRGVTPTPSARGTTAFARGIAQAGNSHIRALAIDMAWGWRRVQPERALTPWSQPRFGHGSRRLRRRGLVALARKLRMAWWRFVETGVLPDGAALKAAGPIERPRR
jgi:transposase